MESLIIQYIQSHPDTWFEDLRAKNIKIKYHTILPLVIFNYDIGADFSDPVVQEARGIIVDTEEMRVVCWPFRKFGNWNESYADEIDWESAVCEDKIDGSIMKLFYYKGEWRWATNGTIDAFEAPAMNTGKTFGNIIKEAVNYNSICYEKLNPDYTYMFELVSPEIQIVIVYPSTKLYHIGSRNNITGEEGYYNIGVEQPNCFVATSAFEDLHKCVNSINGIVQPNQPKVEGYVVVDKNYHRVKIKTPQYLAAHRLANNGCASTETILQLIKENDSEKIEIVCTNIQNRCRFKYYDWQLTELECKINTFISYVRGYYEEVNKDRKAVALAIKDHPLSAFGFMAIGNNLTAAELMNKVKLYKYIKEYANGSTYNDNWTASVW